MSAWIFACRGDNGKTFSRLGVHPPGAVVNLSNLGSRLGGDGRSSLPPHDRAGGDSTGAVVSRIVSWDMKSLAILALAALAVLAALDLAAGRSPPEIPGFRCAFARRTARCL